MDWFHEEVNPVAFSINLSPLFKMRKAFEVLTYDNEK